MKSLENGKRISFEELKLFYDSAEKVTDRRISANKWNYSICVAILAAIAGIISWSLSQPSFIISGFLCVVLLSIMAALYCSLWIGQIRDLKELNNAKFSVINEMSKYVSFGDGTNENLISYEPFEKEWNVLAKSKVTEELKNIKIIAFKSSNIEYLIPRAFRLLFVLLIFIVPFEGWRNYEAISNNQTVSITTSSSKK